MRYIVILRTSPYIYLIPKKDLYTSFDLVALEAVEPKIKIEAERFLKDKVKLGFKPDLVYCSTRKRSRQTAELVVEVPRETRDLNEIRFSMKDFITRDEFYSFKEAERLDQARRRFVRALINDRLKESFRAVISRAEKIIELIKKMKVNGVFFSHGFFMKVVEGLIKDPLIKQKPRRLLKYFDGPRETFYFNEGFRLQKSDSKLVFESYIRNKKEVYD